MPDADRGPDIPKDRSPTRLPGWVTRPASALYRREITRRNAKYDAGVGVERLPVPVISVGNLSAGGTGKTPTVRWVAQLLTEHGVVPAIAMRGYGARPGAMSDEEREHRVALPGVPVVARPDRTAGLRALLDGTDGHRVGCVVLDDGFQHRRLARDLDIVLIDASRPPDRDALLPRGFLREPLGSLARACAVVITHAELVTPSEVERVTGLIRAELRPGVPVGVAEHAWVGMLWAGATLPSLPEPGVGYPTGPGGEPLDHGVGWLRGRRVVAVCAIGHPAGFLDALDRAGADRVASLVLADHDPFDASTRRRLDRLVDARGPEAVVMTAKDYMKLGPWASSSGCPVAVPLLGLAWRSGEKPVHDRVLAAAGIGEATGEPS